MSSYKLPLGGPDASIKSEPSDEDTAMLDVDEDNVQEEEDEDNVQEEEDDDEDKKPRTHPKSGRAPSGRTRKMSQKMIAGVKASGSNSKSFNFGHGRRVKKKTPQIFQPKRPNPTNPVVSDIVPWMQSICANNAKTSRTVMVKVQANGEFVCRESSGQAREKRARCYNLRWEGINKPKDEGKEKEGEGGGKEGEEIKGEDGEKAGKVGDKPTANAATSSSTASSPSKNITTSTAKANKVGKSTNREIKDVWQDLTLSWHRPRGTVGSKALMKSGGIEDLFHNDREILRASGVDIRVGEGEEEERIPGSRVLVEMIEKFEGKIVNPPILSFLNGCESHGEDADGEGNDLKRRTDDDDELVDGAEDEDEEVGGGEKLSLENEFEEEVKAKDAMKIDGEEEYIDDDAATTSSKETSASPEGGSYIDERQPTKKVKVARDFGSGLPDEVKNALITLKDRMAEQDSIYEREKLRRNIQFTDAQKVKESLRDLENWGMGLKLRWEKLCRGEH